MKTIRKILLATALLGTLGIGGISTARTLDSKVSSRPVATVHRSRNNPSFTSANHSMIRDKTTTKTNDSTDDQDSEVKDDMIPPTMSSMGEYGESVYDLAKIDNWTKAKTDFSQLQDAANQYARTNPENSSTQLNQLNTSIERLSSSITTRNRQTAMQNANQVTSIVARLTQQYQTKVPVSITMLDYYGRELEIGAASGDNILLQNTAQQIRQTWEVVRPTIIGRGGKTTAQQFDNLVTRLNQAKSTYDYAQLAKPVLDHVDNLELVFK
ncbi:MAG: hypothetical protein ACRC8K_16570 [Waterburya sp.]